MQLVIKLYSRSIVSYSVSFGAKIFDITKNLIATRIGVECGKTLVLDILEPEGIVGACATLGQRRGAR